MDLALNNLQRLKYYKTQTTQPALQATNDKIVQFLVTTVKQQQAL